MVALLTLSSCGMAKQNKADKERIDKITTEVNSLFNAEQDDLAEGINEKSFKSVEEIIDEEAMLDKQLSDENQILFNQITHRFENAFAMFEFETLVINLQDKDEKIDKIKYELASEHLLLFENEKTFFKRMSEEMRALGKLLEKQIAFEERVLEIEKLLNILIKNDKVSDIVTEKDYEKIATLLDELEDSDEKEELEKELKRIDKKLNKIAKAKRKEEERLAKEKAEGEKRVEQANRKAKERAEEIAEVTKVNKQQTQSGASGTQLDRPGVTEPTYVNGIIIANKNYPLPASYAPGENSEARAAFNKMAQAARDDGISLTAFSTYRSYDYQENLYNNYVARDGQAAADRYSARPGYSEHQTGLAFDIGDSRTPDKYFSETEATKWLAKEAYKYGFILRYPQGKEHITGYKYEPWHYRYVGTDIAKQIYDRKTTLEEYLGL